MRVHAVSAQDRSDDRSPAQLPGDFFSRETTSGALLLAAAAIALACANSPWSATYEMLFGTPAGIRVRGAVFERDLRFWINDGLMAIFFFIVGLEIKRELVVGELRTIRRAALPALAALGGMIVPGRLTSRSTPPRRRRAAGASPWRPTSRSPSACWR